MSDDVLSNIACGEPITESEVNAGNIFVRKCRQSILARYVGVSIENPKIWPLNLAEIEVFTDVTLYNNSCYKVSDTTTESWSDAKAACESQFSTLLTINTEDERTYLTNLMSSSFWTGLNDIEQEGNPEWLTSDTPTYMNYDIAASGDESGDMDCFRIAGNDGSLRHAYCNSEKQYICEGNNHNNYISIVKLKKFISFPKYF
ncbi:C-type lectin domain family 4 member M-like [Antedon mediterranea]|uniref:C-type lectin domain family 4 member M-like n=1 Tax=Antedon mediterranea TaxID=105859 RepID=UPI003AF8BDE3